MENQRITSRDELKRLIGEYYKDVAFYCYTISYDQAIAIAADKAIEILRDEHNFEYGDYLPAGWSDINVYGLISEFECEIAG